MTRRSIHRWQGLLAGLILLLGPGSSALAEQKSSWLATCRTTLQRAQQQLAARDVQWQRGSLAVARAPGSAGERCHGVDLLFTRGAAQVYQACVEPAGRSVRSWTTVEPGVGWRPVPELVTGDGLALDLGLVRWEGARQAWIIARSADRVRLAAFTAQLLAAISSCLGEPEPTAPEDAPEPSRYQPERVSPSAPQREASEVERMFEPATQPRDRSLAAAQGRATAREVPGAVAETEPGLMTEALALAPPVALMHDSAAEVPAPAPPIALAHDSDAEVSAPAPPVAAVLLEPPPPASLPVESEDALLCLMPVSRHEPAAPSFSPLTAGVFSLVLDHGEPRDWPAGPLALTGLDTREKHHVMILRGGRPYEAFRFSFQERGTMQLVLQRGRNGHFILLPLRSECGAAPGPGR